MTPQMNFAAPAKRKFGYDPAGGIKYNRSYILMNYTDGHKLKLTR